MKVFRSLNVWEEAHALILTIYRSTEGHSGLLDPESVKLCDFRIELQPESHPSRMYHRWNVVNLQCRLGGEARENGFVWARCPTPQCLRSKAPDGQ